MLFCGRVMIYRGIDVYRKDIGTEQSFCELELGEASMSGRKLNFDDLNGDGYEDILFGSDRVGSCRLRSASQGRFTEMTEAMVGLQDRR